MQIRDYPLKRATALTIIFFLLAWSYSPICRADATIKHLYDPVPLKFETPVDSIQSETSTPMTLTFTQTVHYHQYFIPQQTQLLGNITQIRQSKRFGRPAYVQADIEKIQFPDGTTKDFNPVVSNRFRVQPAKDQTFPHFMWENLFLGNVSLAATVPLALATGMSLGMFNAVDLGLSIGVAAIYGLKKKVLASSTPQSEDDNGTSHPKTSKLKHVMLSIYEATSPVPPFWLLFTKAKNIHYKAGTQISLPMDRTLLASTFRLCKTHEGDHVKNTKNEEKNVEAPPEKPIVEPSTSSIDPTWEDRFAIEDILMAPYQSSQETLKASNETDNRSYP